MLDRMLAFNRALRDAGIPVSVSENEDALRSLECLAIDRREVMRSALAATMIKNASQRAAFDTLFDLYFGTGAGTEAVALRDEHDRDDDDRALEDAVADALEGGDASAMREVARRAVARVRPHRGGRRLLRVPGRERSGSRRDPAPVARGGGRGPPGLRAKGARGRSKEQRRAVPCGGRAGHAEASGRAAGA